MVRHRGRRVGLVAGIGVVVILVVVAVVVLARVSGRTTPLPGEERCVATASGNAVALDLDQAHYASIVVGLSVRRGLAPRAGSIAMATVYQESGIRNLDYGDRDSVGLFQQRPSQGWGSTKQLMDPYYATGKFYDALVKIKGWQSDDITTIAQRIQISGHPDAYRDHERDGRVLASALTGQSPAGFSCLVRGTATGEPGDLADAVTKTFGVDGSVDGSTITLKASARGKAWAYAHFAVANAKRYGVTAVAVDGRVWRTDGMNLPSWSADASAPGPRGVRISTR